MAKYNTSSLEGLALEFVVRRLMGQVKQYLPGVSFDDYRDAGGVGQVFWDEFGPFIEREKIALCSPDEATAYPRWLASHEGEQGVGPTALIAAQRAWARSKLGDEVEL